MLPSRGKPWFRFGLLLLAGTCAFFLVQRLLSTSPWFRAPAAYKSLPRAVVLRADLQPFIAAGGAVRAAEQTLIECELESHNVASLNSSLRTSGSSHIIDLAPEGSLVKKGDILARLDASEYEELLRQQEILVLQARSNEEQARLDLEVARIALQEYRDGQLHHTRADYHNQIILFESELERVRERLKWTEAMAARGYASQADLNQQRVARDTASTNLSRLRGELETLDRYSAPLAIKRLESAIDQARQILDFQQVNRQNRESQLQNLKDQVKACTITAPHDGLVVYASTVNPWLPTLIEKGATVFNRMDLLYIPNLQTLEIHSEIHESMYQRLKPGLETRIRVTGKHDLLLHGRVKSIEQMPQEPSDWKLAREIRNFLVKISIDAPPPRVYPGMTAEIEIQTQARPGALVVPASAVTVENQLTVVYLPGDDRLERRVVQVAPGDLATVEITSGLAEGEQIILDPTQLDPADAHAARTTAPLAPPLPAAGPGTRAALHVSP